METYCGCSTFRGKYNLRFGGKNQAGYIICCNNSVVFGACRHSAESFQHVFSLEYNQDFICWK